MLYRLLFDKSLYGRLLVKRFSCFVFGFCLASCFIFVCLSLATYTPGVVATFILRRCRWGAGEGLFCMVWVWWSGGVRGRGCVFLGVLLAFVTIVLEGWVDEVYFWLLVVFEAIRIQDCFGRVLFLCIS